MVDRQLDDVDLTVSCPGEASQRAGKPKLEIVAPKARREKKRVVEMLHGDGGGSVATTSG